MTFGSSFIMHARPPSPPPRPGPPSMLTNQIVERGNHDALMELGGEYASMWNIQVQEREKMLSMEKVGGNRENDFVILSHFIYLFSLLL